MTSCPSVTLLQDSKFETGVMIAGCCIAIASLVPVAMYQTGVIQHLPDPPAEVFDSDTITSSREAHPFGIPDSLLGVASFGTTLALILASRRSMAARRLLAAKLVADATVAAFNATRQVVSFGKLCSWCTVTALSAGVTAYGGRDAIRAAVGEAKGFVRSGGSRG
ncbi:MAG: vitamin K epoxide reductase family protein [Granulicella sp.]